MKILAKEKLSEHKYKTPEGYLICVDSVLARTGKQTYTRDELFHDGDETEIEVDRTPEEVFSDATLASFENKPLVVEHPDEDVNSSNIQQYAVGFVRDVKRGELDGEPVMLGTLVITDEQTIKEIEDGEHTDLSCGYDCDIQDEAEPSQKNIRGNHVALCETGRAGIARIVDSVNDATYEVELFPTNGANSLISHFDLLTKAYKFAEDQTTAGKYKKITISTPGLGIVNQWDKANGWKTKYEFRKRVDSVEDGVKLPNDIRKDLSRILAHKSTFTKRDVDVVDLIKELERYFRIDGKKVTFTREGIKGWYRTGDGTLRKDYKFSVDGYDNSDFMISLYADEDYKTTEINAYMLDSIKDSKFEEYMRKLAYIEEYWQVSKLLERAYNELGLDEYKRLREAAEKRKKEILAMHDSRKDALTEKEIRYAFDQFKKRIKVKDPEEFKFVRELAEKKGYAAAYDDHNGYAHIYYDSIDDSDEKVADKFDDVPNWFKSLMLEAKNKIGLRSIGAIVTYIKQNSKIDEDTAREWYMQCYSKLGLPAWEKEAWRDAEDVEDSVNDAKSFKIPARTTITMVNKAPYGSNANLIEGEKTITTNKDIIATDLSSLRKQCEKLFIEKYKSEKGTEWGWSGDFSPKQFANDSTKDAMEKYYIRWINTYNKSKGWDKSFWLYNDEVKANSAKEALDKLANIAVMRGVGTRYVTIVNIKTDKTSYQVSGNIDDLRKRQLDSMASTYEKVTKGLKEQLNNVGDSCKVGKYKVTKIK